MILGLARILSLMAIILASCNSKDLIDDKDVMLAEDDLHSDDLPFAEDDLHSDDLLFAEGVKHSDDMLFAEDVMYSEDDIHSDKDVVCSSILSFCITVWALMGQ